MKLYFTLLLSLFTFYASAQTGIIRGCITDASRAPLPGMTIILEGTKYGTSTDEGGNFNLSKVLPGSYTLVVSGVGYTAQKQNVLVSENQVTALNLELSMSEKTLKEVVVTGDRPYDNIASGATRSLTPLRDLPQSVQIINQKTLQEQQVFRIDEALKNVAGVHMSNAQGSFNFRGFTTNAGSFLTNGMKGTGYPEGVMPFLANVERIEVLRGPTAILYGEGAQAGNLNVITKQPRKLATVNAAMSAGSFDLLRAQGDVTGSLNKSQTLYGVAGIGYERGGKFTQNFDHQTLQLFGSMKWEISPRTSWQVNSTYNRDRSTSFQIQDVPFYEGRLFSVADNFATYGKDAFYKGDSYQLQSQFQHRFTADWNANLWLGYSKGYADQVYYSFFDYVNEENLIERSWASQIRSTPQKTVNAFINGSFSVAGIKNRITSGVDLSFSNASYPKGILQYGATPLYVKNPDYSPFTPGEDAILYYHTSSEKFINNTSGVYLQDQVSFTDKLKALAGIRFNHYHFSYRADSLSYDMANFETYEEKPENTTAFIPRLGLVYQPTASHSFYVDYSTGFVPQYNNSKDVNGPFDPERTHQLEAGWKGSLLSHRLVPTVALYQITKNNVLKTDPNAPEGLYWLIPIGTVQSRGAELTLTGTILQNWNAIVNYSYNLTKVTESNNDKEVGQLFGNNPQHMGSLWTTYHFDQTILNGLKLGFGYRYTGDRYITNKRKEADELVLPAYTVADAMASYSYRWINVQVNVNNFLNTRYAQSSYWSRSYFPGAPRNVMLTVGYTLK